MCDCDFTDADVKKGIYDFAEKENTYRITHDIWDEISYECSICRNPWLEVGNILNCPKCNMLICVPCINLFNALNKC
jgi:hypothetical protein